jgi:N-acetylglucosaminyl-diphospho-decaprenol L-rhamnosyltransferase
VDLSVVIVTWNSAEHLPDCIEALDGELPFASEVVVVDNASTDASASVAASLGARVLANGTNEGFGRACNRGARESTGNVVLFLNPDTVVRPGAVKAARRALVAAPGVGAVGGALVAEDGSPQPAADEFITPARFALRTLRTAAGRGGPATRPPAGPVDWVFGAFLMVRRDAFEAAGGFDPDYHMYYEDMDLCWRLREAGWQTRFAPDAECVHLGGASAAHRWDGHPGEEKARSLLLFERKHATPAQVVAFRVAATAAYAAFAGVQALRGGSRKARPYVDMARTFARG